MIAAGAQTALCCSPRKEVQPQANDAAGLNNHGPRWTGPSKGEAMRRNGSEPYAQLRIGAVDVPLFLITFDREGTCTSPRALAAVLDGARTGRYRDAHLYSHGWNNTFPIAKAKYEAFFSAYGEVRESAPKPADLGTSVFIGIIWPSTALVAPSERTPQIAAIGPGDGEIELLRDALALDDAATKTLSQSDNPAEVAAVLAPLFADGDATPGTSVTPAQIVAFAAHATRGNAGPRRFGYVGAAAGAGPGPDALALPGPRTIVRIATVRLMKDRAATVGAFGIGPRLLQPLLKDSAARLHGIGHSYGVAVMLAALCVPEQPRRLSSLLLLQGAISRFCFAADLGRGLGSGGYRAALERVDLPIFATHSDRDQELHNLFHLAVCRTVDYGELRFAGLYDPYKALGGYGPAQLEQNERVDLDLHDAGVLYPMVAGARVYALDGSNGKIASHGDVDNERTAWAHAALVGGGFKT